MSVNLHDADKSVPIELPEFFHLMTATQMVQAAIGLDLPVAYVLEVGASLAA